MRRTENLEKITYLEKSQVRHAVRRAMTKRYYNDITPDIADVWDEIDQLPEYTLPDNLNKPDFSRNKRQFR